MGGSTFTSSASCEASPRSTIKRDVFYFPDINGDRPVLTAGNFAAAFNDDPATMAVLEYMATADYAENRQRIQSAELDGSLSARQGACV